MPRAHAAESSGADCPILQPAPRTPPVRCSGGYLEALVLLLESLLTLLGRLVHPVLRRATLHPDQVSPEAHRREPAEVETRRKRRVEVLLQLLHGPAVRHVL